jgi:3-hydroxy-3-methylglutaryl CoA synthase
MMVIKSAGAVGIKPDKLYFNIERVGNASSASIPLAICDAVREGVIKKKTRIFAPGFGAGAVGGYSVILVDPAVVDLGTAAPSTASVPNAPARNAATTTDDVKDAFHG